MHVLTFVTIVFWITYPLLILTSANKSKCYSPRVVAFIVLCNAAMAALAYYDLIDFGPRHYRDHVAMLAQACVVWAFTLVRAGFAVARRGQRIMVGDFTFIVMMGCVAVGMMPLAVFI